MILMKMRIVGWLCAGGWVGMRKDRRRDAKEKSAGTEGWQTKIGGK